MEVFTQHKWMQMLSTVEKVSPTLVQEFYAKMHDFHDGAF
jgi:hypothetical protein